MGKSVILNVNGMKCGGCESNVTSKLLQMKGVITATASHQNKQVSIEFDEGETSLETLIDVIKSSGYSVE
ncbi:MAG: heavy metal-associated domain-containing protein [Methylococcaceae bacterium]